MGGMEIFMDNKANKAEMLAQALPYIQEYYNKTIVIKYGGNAMLNEELKMAVIKNVILLHCVGINVVLVHGGGPEISDMLNKIGKKSEFIDGLRYTDNETMDIVQQVLCGKINKDLVALLEREGGQAIGLCGLDHSLIEAKLYKKADRDYGRVGRITKVNPAVVENTIGAGYIPVIATVACAQEDGGVYNINADLAAARIAVEVKAEKLILLTDVRGLLRDRDDEDSLIPEVKVSEIAQLQQEGILQGGMIPKIECCVEAVRRGVKRAHIIDGRIPNSILIELFSNEGIGTMIY